MSNYEIKNNSLQLLLQILSKNHDLTKKYCNGELYLPSFITIKKAKNYYLEYCKEDKELDQLFVMAINYSKLFYVKLFRLIQEKNIQYQYETLFESRAEPFGQKLVNTITNIRLRIKMIKSAKIKSLEKARVKNVFSLFTVKNQLTKLINLTMYKLSLYLSINQKVTKILYYFSATCLICLVLYISFVLNHNDLSIFDRFISSFFAIVILLVTIFSYPLNDFALRDISGKNIVAYRYKTLLNYSKNHKLVDLFTMQHMGDDTFSSKSSTMSK